MTSSRKNVLSFSPQEMSDKIFTLTNYIILQENNVKFYDCFFVCKTKFIQFFYLIKFFVSCVEKCFKQSITKAYIPVLTSTRVKRKMASKYAVREFFLFVLRLLVSTAISHMESQQVFCRQLIRFCPQKAPTNKTMCLTRLLVDVNKPI